MVIEFDVELAKLALAAGTGKIVTRDGRDVIIKYWNHGLIHYPLLGYINNKENDPHSWTEGGRYVTPGIDSSLDLFIKELV